MAKPTFSMLLFRQLIVVWCGLAAMGVYLFAMSWGPYLESRYFPVTEDYEVVDYREMSGGVGIRIRFDKVRPCDYGGMAWYSGTPFTEASRVWIVFHDQYMGNANTRSLGTHTTGWWDVYLSDRDKEKPMFGVVEHECGLPWTSRTVIGPFDQGRLIPVVPTSADAITAGENQ